MPLFTNVAVLIHVANEQHTILSDQKRHARKLKYLIYQQIDRKNAEKSAVPPVKFELIRCQKDRSKY